MTKTAAERQADYRKKRPLAGDNGERRIGSWVTTGTYLALGRLARRYGVTNREMLQQLIGAAEQNIVSTLDLDSSEWSVYYGVTP